MKIRSIGRQITDGVKLYTYPMLDRLAGKAINEVLDVASIKSRSQLEGWFYRKVVAVKRHFLIYSEVEKMVQRAGFDNIEEARAAVKALKGCLNKRNDNQCFTGKFPVFISTNTDFLAEKTAYIYFLDFISKVGKGNIFSNVDFSPAAIKLFQRALWDGLIKEIRNGSQKSTWVVSNDPLLFLQAKVEKLPIALREILCRK